ncbi:MAG: type II toxin-antitoxin system HicA family toxin [Bryobacteraceae bacterium]
MLEVHGWVRQRINGSHHIYAKSNSPCAILRAWKRGNFSRAP